MSQESISITNTILLLGVTLVVMIAVWGLIYGLRRRISFRLLRGLAAVPVLGCAATYLVALLYLPGVAVHEFSHALFAWLTGGRVAHMTLIPREQQGGVTWGEVGHTRGDPLLEGFVGLAPLLFGSALVFFLTRRVVDLEALGAVDNLFQFFDVLLATAGGLLRSPLIAYLLFAIGNGAIPSPSTDFRNIFITGTLLMILTIMVVTAVTLLVPGLPGEGWWLQQLLVLLMGFSLVLFMDIIAASVLWVLQKAFGAIGLSGSDRFPSV